jgi:hypothetical protein
MTVCPSCFFGDHEVCDRYVSDNACCCGELPDEGDIAEGKLRARDYDGWTAL